MADLSAIDTKRFTSVHVLVRNTYYNLIGQGVPILVAMIAIPLLVRGLGVGRFGILSLVWIFIGYFSMFDLGLGRALTKLVSEKIGTGSMNEISPLIWTALTIMGGLGLLSGILLAGVSIPLTRNVLRIPVEFQNETVKSFYLLAAALPVVITTAGLRGVLEAYQCFGLLNAVRVPLGMLSFLGPLAVLPFSSSLFPVVGVLVAGRLLGWFIHLGMFLHVVPWLRNNMYFDRKMLRPLLSFGGWMTVSNIIGPLMLYMDRFVIAASLSVVAVAYYTTPFEIITKLLIIPSAVVGTLFPSLGVAFAQKPARAAYLYKQTMKYVFVTFIPVVFLVVFSARWALRLWLNEEFAANSFHVAQFLVIGVLFNSLGLVSQCLIQASGRPDLTAKLHLVELPLYLTYLWGFLHLYGINGVAFAWVVRVALSALVLAFLARRSLLGTAAAV